MWRLPSIALPDGEASIMFPPHRQAVAGAAVVNKPTTFLFGIFAMLNDTDHRQMTRRTMLGSDLPEAVRSRICSLSDYLENRANTNICQIIYTFVIGASKSSPPNYVDDPIQLVVQNKTIEEGEKDLTLLNIRENMNEGKTPSWFHYANTLPGIDYISKLDLDTLVSMPQLLNFVNHKLPHYTPSRPTRVFGGLLLGSVCGAIRIPSESWL
jgi:hypothetical protein